MATRSHRNKRAPGRPHGPAPRPTPAQRAPGAPAGAGGSAGKRGPGEQRPPLSHLLGWTVLLLLLYVPSIALPWYVFTQWGANWALLAALAIVFPWLFASRHRPAGFNLAPFAVGMMVNFVGVIGSWLLQLF